MSYIYIFVLQITMRKVGKHSIITAQKKNFWCKFINNISTKAVFASECGQALKYEKFVKCRFSLGF